MKIPDADLEQAAQSLASALAAGLNLPDALAVAAAAARGPLQTALTQTLACFRVGVPLEAALERLAGSGGHPELCLFARALQLGLSCGGGLPRLLAGLSLTLRERRLLKSELRARSAEGRWTAVVLAACPLLLGLYLVIVDPNLLVPLLLSASGRLALLVAGVLWLVGLLAVWRLVTPPALVTGRAVVCGRGFAGRKGRGRHG